MAFAPPKPRLADLQDVLLTSPIDFQALRFDDPNDRWVNDSFIASVLLNKSTTWRQNEFFYHDSAVSAVNEWNPSTAGTGAGPTVGGPEANHPGIFQFVTGTTATGRQFAGWASSNGSGKVVFGSGVVRLGVIQRIPTLSTAAEHFIVRNGYFDAVNLVNPIVDGAYFRYEESVNGGRWECRCVAASVETVLDSGVTVVAGTWYLLELEVNAAGTSVQFFINRVSVGSIATNVPTAGVGPVFGINKTIGTTSRSVAYDYCYEYQRFTVDR